MSQDAHRLTSVNHCALQGTYTQNRWALVGDQFNFRGDKGMANITRFDPFGEPLDDFFRRMFKPVRWEAEEQALNIKLDVEEDDKSYRIKAEIPGVKKEDINVRIDGTQVSISAESRRENEVKEKGKVIRSERYHGSLFRSFSLAHDVDQAGASAKYADGILELSLPKKAGAQARKLTVQ
jgi:HSP20 family protein